MSKGFKRLVKIAVASDEEAVAQTEQKILTREVTRLQTDVLFDNAKSSRKADRAKVEKLFIQTPGAETMAPTLQKEAVAKNVAEFFEKQASGLTEAQRRFPELLKVSNATGPVPRPSLTQPKKMSTPSPSGGASVTSGPSPVRSGLSGGSP